MSIYSIGSVIEWLLPGSQCMLLLLASGCLALGLQKQTSHLAVYHSTHCSTKSPMHFGKTRVCFYLFSLFIVLYVTFFYNLFINLVKISCQIDGVHGEDVGVTVAIKTRNIWKVFVSSPFQSLYKMIKTTLRLFNVVSRSKLVDGPRPSLTWTSYWTISERDTITTEYAQR